MMKRMQCMTHGLLVYFNDDRHAVHGTWVIGVFSIYAIFKY